MSWIAVGIGAAVGATGGAIIGSKKGGDDVWKGALLGGVLGAAGGGIGGAAFGGGAAAAEGAGGAALGGAAEGTALGGAAAAGESTGIAGLAGAGGTTIPGIGTAAAAPIAGTTTAAIPGTALAGTGAGGASGMLGGTAVGGVGSAAAAPIAGTTTATLPGTAVASGAGSAGSAGGAGGSGIGGWWSGLGNLEKAGIIGVGTAGLGALMNRGNSSAPTTTDTYTGPLSQFKYSPSTYSPTYAKPNVYTATYADGGIASSDPMNPIQNPIYPQSQQEHTNFATSNQYPNSISSAMGADYDARTNPMTGAELPLGMADGGIASLGGYSDGGQLLKGPGDGVSDSIPASIGSRQPARLADGEFVVPARAVSELGNGSTEAGAKQLYSMLDRIQKKRKKGSGLAYQSNPKKMLPA